MNTASRRDLLPSGALLLTGRSYSRIVGVVFRNPIDRRK